MVHPYTSCNQSTSKGELEPGKLWSWTQTLSFPLEQFSIAVKIKTHLCNLTYGTDDPVYKTEADHGHGETCGCQGEVGRKWDGWRVWGWGMQTVTFGMNWQWVPIGQHRELHNRNWKYCKSTIIKIICYVIVWGCDTDFLLFFSILNTLMIFLKCKTLNDYKILFL